MLLQLENLRKDYHAGLLRRRRTFSIAADLAFDRPAIIGMLGPNGAGKTTLFEMMTGSNRPTAGRVLVNGADIHRVKYAERDRLAIHYHQSYQVRRFAKRMPSFLLAKAASSYPLVHLFDEPQFNTQDGYIGFMLDFFRRLRAEDRLVFVCVHPTGRHHLQILREICESFLFVAEGAVAPKPGFAALLADPLVRRYLGDEMVRHAEALA